METSAIAIVLIVITGRYYFIFLNYCKHKVELREVIKYKKEMKMERGE